MEREKGGVVLKAQAGFIFDPSGRNKRLLSVTLSG